MPEVTITVSDEDFTTVSTIDEMYDIEPAVTGDTKADVTVSE